MQNKTFENLSGIYAPLFMEAPPQINFNILKWTFQGEPVVKNLPANAGGARGAGSISGVRKVSWRRKLHNTSVFLPEIFHGQRSLVGYRSWGHRVGCNWATEGAHTQCTYVPYCMRLTMLHFLYVAFILLK